MLVRAWFQEERESYTYDSTFYAERLATAFGRVTEVFGVECQRSFSGKQANLSVFLLSKAFKKTMILVSSVKAQFLVLILCAASLSVALVQRMLEKQWRLNLPILQHQIFEKIPRSLLMPRLLYQAMARLLTVGILQVMGLRILLIKLPRGSMLKRVVK